MEEDVEERQRKKGRKERKIENKNEVEIQISSLEINEINSRDRKEKNGAQIKSVQNSVEIDWIVHLSFLKRKKRFWNQRPQ